MVTRLVDDHATATALAAALRTVDGFEVDASGVETNIVFAGVARLGSSTRVASTLREYGVLVSDAPPDHIRFVTHRHVGLPDVERTLSRIRTAMAALAAVSAGNAG
jgi:threonine aldolase